MPPTRRAAPLPSASGSPAWPRNGLTATLDASGQSGGIGARARDAAALMTASDGGDGASVDIVSIEVSLIIERSRRLADATSRPAGDRGWR